MHENGEKKTFDSTVCYTFYGNWYDAISKLETETDKNSCAYRLFKAISEYSLYGIEPDFSEQFRVLDVIWSVIATEIDNCIVRRKRGFGEEVITEEYRAIIDAVARNPRASIREIARMVGVNKNKVDRVRKKYEKEIAEATDAYALSVNPALSPSGDFI